MTTKVERILFGVKVQEKELDFQREIFTINPLTGNYVRVNDGLTETQVYDFAELSDTFLKEGEESVHGANWHQLKVKREAHR